MYEEPDYDAVSSAYNRLQSNPSIEAVKSLENLAHQGSLMSALHVAWAYQKGLGVSIDESKAETWYKTAMKIDKNSGLATYYFGHFYLTMKHFEKAKEIFELGESLGYSPSIYCLGCLFLEGNGCEKNPQIALNLFKTAAELGHVFAQRSLAGMYLTGQYGFINMIKGLFLFFASLKNGLLISIRDPDSDLLHA